MLSQSLFKEIMSNHDIYDLTNVYEEQAKSAKKDYFEIKKGMKQFLNETSNNKLGDKAIKFIM